MVLFLAILVLPACNDKPTDLLGPIVPGTDSVTVITSIDMDILPTEAAAVQRRPIINNTYFLFGAADDAEARLFVEPTEYPAIGTSEQIDVLSSELEFIPQTYAYGDTASQDIVVRGYELTKAWSALITWDSVFSSDGTSSYYDVSSSPIVNFSGTISTTDSIVRVPVTPSVVERWLSDGQDTILRKNIFGMALVAPNGRTIRQYRNLTGTNQVFLIRVVYKHRDSTTNDTIAVRSAVSSLVNTATPADQDLVIRGGHMRYTTFDVDLTSLPTNAVIVGATLSVTIDESKSQAGKLGYDEIVQLRYEPDSTTAPYFTSTRITADKRYVYAGVAPFMQQILRRGGKGRLQLRPTDANELWRTNRITLYNRQASADVRPKLTIVYAIPLVMP